MERETEGRFKGFKKLVCTIPYDKGHQLDHNNHYQREALKPVIENPNDPFCVVKLYELYTSFWNLPGNCKATLFLYKHPQKKVSKEKWKHDYGDPGRVVGPNQFREMGLHNYIHEYIHAYIHTYILGVRSYEV